MMLPQLRSLALALLVGCLPLSVQAQSPAPEPIAADQLQALAEELGQATGIDETRLAELQGQLDSANQWLAEEATFRAQARDYENTASGAAQAIERFKQQTAEAQANPPATENLVPAGAAPEEFDSQIALLQADRQTLSERRALLLKRVEDRPTRRAAAQARLAEAQGEIQATRGSLDRPAQTLEQRIQRAAARARMQRLQAERAALEAEVLSEPARMDVTGAERLWLAQALADVDLKLEALGKAAEAARSSASAEKLEATEALQEQLRNEDPAVQALADDNRRLAVQLREATEKLETARGNGRDMQAQLESIEQSSNLMRRRLDVAGRKEVLARVMITRMNSLPDVSDLKGDIKARNDIIADTSIAYIDVDEALRDLSRRSDFLQEQGIDPASLDAGTARLVDEALNQRRQLLENGLKSLGSLQRILIDNNEVSGKLIAASEGFHQFLIGNLLWVRNFTFFNVEMLSDQLRELVSPYNWIALPAHLYGGYEETDWSEMLLVLLFVAAILSWRLRGPYRALMRRPTPLSAESLLAMVAGLLMAALLVLPWPLALWLLGHFLANDSPGTPFTDALSVALITGGRFLFALLFLRKMVHPFGVGRRLLKWDARMLESVRRELNWAGPIFVLGGIIERFAFQLDTVATGGPLGSLANAVLTILGITVVLRLQRQPLFREVSSVRNSLRLVAAVGAAIILMQALGLLFAAEIFLVSLGRTILVVLLIKTVSDVIERWLLILRGRIERKKREELRAQEESGEELPEDTDAWVDMVSLSSAHSSLLSLGRVIALAASLWVIWAPTLPGLSLLDGVTLWQVVDSADPTGALRAITLADLLYSVFLLVVTALVAKHLPSVLQAVALEWFKFSAGARYASGILTQYLVIAIGGSMFLSAIGWEWSKLQWLVAALGVGIGFGLQEIVANFISGLIILFERPVRVGDVISVAGSEGTVLEIKPRATVIQTFDRKEVMIPNKELITGQVVNWSLSDSAVRVLVPVGVAYGSDVRRAQELMLEAASEVELVQAEPEPMVSFDDFGDNSLLLTLRCYVAENRLWVWTELRNRINDKFIEAGIEISFPQRDVHLNTKGPLQVELRGGTAPEGSA